MVVDPTGEQEANPQEIRSQRWRIRINLGVAGFCISLATLGVTPILYLIDKNDDYRLNQQAIQPDLLITALDPKYTLILQSNPFASEDSVKMVGDSIFELATAIEIKLKFTIKNIGNAKGRAWFHMFRDSP